MQPHYLIGRFIPIAPGWTVDAWVAAEGETNKDTWDVVGWYLCEGDKWPDFWAPAVWEDDKLEPVYPRHTEAYSIVSVEVHRTDLI